MQLKRTEKKTIEDDDDARIVNRFFSSGIDLEIRFDRNVHGRKKGALVVG